MRRTHLPAHIYICCATAAARVLRWLTMTDTGVRTLARWRWAHHTSAVSASTHAVNYASHPRVPCATVLLRVLPGAAAVDMPAAPAYSSRYTP